VERPARIKKPAGYAPAGFFRQEWGSPDQPVTAPLLADDASAEYLNSTPRV
jgi:hypothetical protein